MSSRIYPTLHSDPSPNNFLKTQLKHASLYICEIWDYNSDKTDLINHSIERFDQSKMFLGKNVHEQVKVILFNKTVLNTFHNFISKKIIVLDKNRSPSDE